VRGDVAHPAIEEGAVDLLIGGERSGIANVIIALEEKNGDAPRDVGGLTFDFLAHARVQRLHRVGDRELTDFVDCPVGAFGQAVGVERQQLAETFGLGPGEPGQQDQRQHLDNDENGDQLAADSPAGARQQPCRPAPKRRATAVGSGRKGGEVEIHRRQYMGRVLLRSMRVLPAGQAAIAGLKSRRITPLRAATAAWTSCPVLR
jgi:hypothetical protein